MKTTFTKCIILYLSMFLSNVYAQTYTVNTLAGSGAVGNTDGTGTSALFNSPTGIAVDASGNVYVADKLNNVIRKITSAGAVTTFAGSGTIGSTDANGTAASFKYPIDVAVDATGNVYVADFENHSIRKITPSGDVTTLAGSGTAGNTDGTGTAASFNFPAGVAVDASGNVYVADSYNHTIRKITPAGIVTTIAGSGSSGSANGTGMAASFNSPSGVAVDGSGNVFVTDQYNNTIRKITSAGVVSTLAGSIIPGSTDGTGAAASFFFPNNREVDIYGNVYVADYSNDKIRKITSSGVVSTLAGTGTSGSVDGSSSIATFTSPADVALDAAGNLYIADFGNNKIRKITITKLTQTITGLSDISKLTTDASFTLSGVASSNLEITYTSSNTSVATISGNTVTIVGAGVTTITASQAGDDTYSAASDVTITLTVSTTTSVYNSAESKIQVYPNPCVDVAIIDLSGNKNIRFINNEGKTVLDLVTSENTIPLQTLKEGIYTMEVVIDGKIYYTKLIKK